MSASPPQSEIFRIKREYLLFPIGIAAVGIVGIGYLQPTTLFIVLPFFALILTLVATGNSGLILSPEGLQWYAIHPRWRFRTVPWHAILNSRNGFFRLGSASFGPILLTIVFEQYEPWVWGKARRDQRDTIEIWTKHLVRGSALWESIQQWLKQQEESNAIAASTPKVVQ